ncbi:transmembrane protein, putative (macronuclear) [Tetrahymena thermophila SB210]|uniref:Transmembrane protein, putative n=1 Tax=Tetrahymena thermophila (strain SB210) TaxID=312017 RepID=I7MIR3_TETTS|nr:transmembrane protein, putative [Tetrahymena thermophila SB210]EAR94178.2 transmembrane protein, putative [Tetrahymena thermophila SB210]|eukprot:XP_001014423.2 transmembrane protein, putative [Tetrahymena thermophila SB210]
MVGFHNLVIQIIIILLLEQQLYCSFDHLAKFYNQNNDTTMHTFQQSTIKKRNLQSTAQSCQTSSTFTNPPFIVNPLAISLYTQDQINSSQSQLELGNIIFNFTAQSIANITIDIRQMFYYNTTQGTQLTYGQDWQYCILLNQTLSVSDCSAGCLALPQTFTNQMALNVNIHRFSLYSMIDQQLTILALINNPQYQSIRLNLLNTVSLSLSQPNRAVYNQNVSFAFYISSSQIAVPVNSIPLNRQGQANNYLLSYQQNYFNNFTINNTNLTGNPSTTTPSQYYLSLNGMFMPYIPYFSNCRSFGSMGFLYEITENQNNCNLVDPSEVKVVNQFKFGDVPHSDECSHILYDCVLDEYLNYNFITNTWLQQNVRTTIFQMTPQPIYYDQNDLNNQAYNSNYLANVLTLNVIPNGQLPTKIVFQIGYYQVTPTVKQIIIGKIWFENFVKPSNDQANGVEPFNYQLDFSFHSMNQSELTINYALSIWVYIFMYMICGSVSLTSVCVFAGYHLLFRRQKSKIKTNIKQCLKVFYPGALFGIYLPMIPVAMILTLNLLLMGGQMWLYPFNIYNCNPQAGNCQLSIFDTMTNLSLTDPGLPNLRKGRFGLSLLVIGLYMMILCANLIVPKSKNKVDKKQGQVSFDGNVWFKRMWEISKYMFFYLGVVVIMEIIIYWSLSNNFGNNTWYYLCTLKVVGMVCERLGVVFFQKFILSSPIAFAMDHILDVATLGANDYLAFLLSFFLEQGIQMYERTYVNVIVEEVEDFIWETYCQVKGILVSAWEKYQSEDNFDNSDAFTIGDRQEFDQISESNSNIILSENLDESVDSNFVLDNSFENIPKEVQKVTVQKKLQQESNNIANQQLKFDGNEESFDEERDCDEFESIFSSNLQYKKDKKQYERIQKQEIKRDDQAKKQKEKIQKHKHKHKQKEEIDTKSFKCIERYGEFFNGMLGPLLLPITTLESWLFYNQIDLANNYNIQQQFYIIYFVYTLVILPFRLAIDIVYYHLWIVYHDIDFLPYATKCKQRFENRRKVWKADQTTSESDNDKNNQQDKNNNSSQKQEKESKEREEEQEFKDIDKWCYSSQYYFVSSLFLIGMMQCVLGLYEITFTNYGIFGDRMLVPIILLWVSLCFVVHQLCLFLGRILGIWKIKVKQENPAQNNTNDEQPKSNSNQEQQEDDIEKNIELAHQKNVILTQREKEKEKKSIFKKLAQNLEKTQFENQHFRKNFILSNKLWLKNNIKNILDKETKKKYRDQIIEQMESIDVKLQQRRNMKKFLLMRKLKGTKKKSFLIDNNEDYEETKLINKNKKDLKRLNSQKSYQDDQSDIEFDILYDIYQQDLLLEGERRDSFSKFEAMVQPNRPTEIPYSVKTILRYWLYRSRNYSKACSLVGGIYDRNLKKYCQFCGNTWGLICQSEQNVEDLFQIFIKSKNQKNIFTDKQKDSWQDFFQENCNFRTECLECNQVMIQEYFKQIKSKEQNEKTRKESTNLFENRNSNGYFNFLFDDQLKNDQQTNQILQNISFQNAGNKQIQNTILPISNDEETNKDDYDLENLKNYQVSNKQNNIRHKYVRQSSINKPLHKVSNPLLNSQDTITGSQLNINKSSSKIPFITQQTNISNIQSQNGEEDSQNEEEEQKQNIQKHIQKEQQSLSYNTINTNNPQKQSQNLGSSDILQVRLRNFSDFEEQAEESPNISNLKYNLDKSDDEELSRQNTERGLLTKNNLVSQNQLKISLNRLKSQQTNELENLLQNTQNAQKGNLRDIVPARNRGISEYSDIKVISYNTSPQSLIQVPTPLQQIEMPQIYPDLKSKLVEFCILWKNIAKKNIESRKQKQINFYQQNN